MPHLRLNRNWVEFGIWLDKLSIHLLAFWAPLDKFPNVIIQCHVLPVESTADLFYCLVTAKVATCSEKNSTACWLKSLYIQLPSYTLHTCRASMAWLKDSLLFILASCSYFPWFLTSGGTFPVVQDSTLNLEIVSALSPQICFFTLRISFGILPAQKIVFDFVKLAHTSPTE